MSRIEVDCAESIYSGNLNLSLRGDRANKERKSHLLCTFDPDTILGNSFAQFYSGLTKFQWNRYRYLFYFKVKMPKIQKGVSCPKSYSF